jgi:hypothetical protein
MSVYPACALVMQPPKESSDEKPTPRTDKSDSSTASTDASLSDVLLVVVGTGEQAEQLCRRRLAAGGRLLWLHTDQPPLVAPLGDAFAFRPPPQVTSHDARVLSARQRLGAFPGQEWLKKGPDVVELPAGCVAEVPCLVGLHRKNAKQNKNELSAPLGAGVARFKPAEVSPASDRVRVRELDGPVLWDCSGRVLVASDADNAPVEIEEDVRGS